MGKKTEEFIVSVPIVVSSIPVYDKVYLIPTCVLKFISDLWFLTTMKPTTMISLKYS